ncbi:MAG: hypothetical protein NTW14_10940 [bacterium]|nr:hypothetical protein [bacterium]
MMLETILERRATAEEHYRRGLRLKGEGYLLEAEQEFKLSMEVDPAYFDPLLEILIEQEETGVSEDIRTDELLRRADQKYRLGMALLKHKRAEKAIRHLNDACQSELDNAKYLVGLAEALADCGRLKEAKENLRIAAELHGGSDPLRYRARAHLLLSEMHLKDGHLRRARRRVMMAHSLDPKNEDIALMFKRVKIGPIQRMFLVSHHKDKERQKYQAQAAALSKAAQK